jgi:hypothetical protein
MCHFDYERVQKNKFIYGLTRMRSLDLCDNLPNRDVTHVRIKFGVRHIKDQVLCMCNSITSSNIVVVNGKVCWKL